MLRHVLTGLAGLLCRLAMWKTPTRHVGFSWHDGRLRISYVDVFTHSHYRVALCPEGAPRQGAPRRGAPKADAARADAQ